MDKLIDNKSNELQNNYVQNIKALNNKSHQRLKVIERETYLRLNYIEEKLINKSLQKELNNMKWKRAYKPKEKDNDTIY